MYKKVSYRKQSARQHWCHNFLARTGGVVDPVKISLYYSFIKIWLLFHM